MDSIAYALRAEHHDTYLGGVLAIGDDSLDVRQALEDGNGFIVIDATNSTALMVLDAYPPLERVEIPADDHEGLPVGYVEPDSADPADEPSVADLRAQAKQLGIEKPGRSREEIQAAIAAHVTAPPENTDAEQPAAPDADTATGTDSAPGAETTTEG